MPIRTNARRTLLTPPKYTYQLYDSFEVPLAAGAINSTLATARGIRSLPTPAQATRNIVDTQSKLSISGGQLSCSGGKSTPAWGDPALFYGGFARQDGLGLFCTVTPTTVTTQLLVGWVNTNPPTALSQAQGLLFANIGGAYRLQCNDGSAATTFATFTLGNTYQVYVALRYNSVASLGGVACFIKSVTGTEYPFWTAVGKNNNLADTTMYPAIMVNNAVATFSNPRISQKLWLFKPWLSDALTLAGADLNGTVSDGLANLERQLGYVGCGGTGRVWSASANKWPITQNVLNTGGVNRSGATGTPTLGSTLTSGNLVKGQFYKIIATQANHFYSGCQAGDYFQATATTAINASNTVQLVTMADIYATVGVPPYQDGYISIDLKDTGRNINGVFARVDSVSNPQNGIFYGYSGRSGVTFLNQVLSGTTTNLGSWGVSYVDFSKCFISIVKNQVTPYYGSVALTTPVTIDSSILTGSWGFWAIDPTGIITDVESFPWGSGNEYAELDTIG